jgi:hypothetical protein
MNTIKTTILNQAKSDILNINSTNIDFNYPSLNRKDLMYLSTVNNNDFPLRKFKQLHTNRNWSINLYNLDIEGSSPRKFGAFNQKVDYINKNDDIERSSPKQLHIKLKKPEYNLSNSDIEYSQPHCVKCKIKRHLNPLEPKYTLPKSPNYPPYEPKFIRDNIDVKDIEGARPKKIMSNNILRESLKNDDVKDSWPKKPYIRKTKYEFMDYRDVTHTEFQTKRNTNPLNPFYTMNFVDGTKVKFGPIEKNRPLVGSKYMYKVPLNLKLDDIEGSNIGSKNKYKKFTSNNSCYDISDIVGTQTGSLLKGISTKRRTNPLWPKYKYLGAEELKGCHANNPFNNYNTITSFNRSKSMIHNCNNNEKDCKKDSNKEEKTINNSNNEIITEVINQTNDNDEEQNEKNEKTKKTPTPKNGKTENNEGSKKILDKKVKITKNNNKFIGPDGKPDFKNIPYMEDIVEFDKNKFKKPTPYYSIQHDKFLIPPIEEFKRNQIKVNPDLRSFKEVSQERTKFIKKNKASTLLTDPYKTYATKLDDFMTSNNSKFNNNACNKNIASFIETGLPENIPEPENKGHTENYNATSSRISNKSNTES